MTRDNIPPLFNGVRPIPPARLHRIYLADAWQQEHLAVEEWKPISLRRALAISALFVAGWYLLIVGLCAVLA